VSKPAFDRGILFLIAISSIVMAIDSPLADPHSTLSLTLSAIDIILVIFFTIEMLLKVIVTPSNPNPNPTPTPT
jgi:hypothetical protein